MRYAIWPLAALAPILSASVGCASQPQAQAGAPATALADMNTNIICEYHDPPPPYGHTPYYITCRDMFQIDVHYGLAYKRDGSCTDTIGITPSGSLRYCFADFISETKCKDVTPEYDVSQEQYVSNPYHIYRKVICSPMSDAELQTLLQSPTN